MSGSGTVSAPKLATTELTTKISGSGTITVNGAANDQDLEISGSGRYQAEGLTSKTVKAVSPEVATRALWRPTCWTWRSAAVDL